MNGSRDVQKCGRYRTLCEKLRPERLSRALRELLVAEVKSDDVFLKFHVPVDQGNAIMAQDIRVQLNLIGGIACPSRLEPVWKILGPDGDIVINPAVNLQIFSDVPCRDYGQ